MALRSELPFESTLIPEICVRAIRASYPFFGFFELNLQILDLRNSSLLESGLDRWEINFLPADQLKDVSSILRIIGPSGLGENEIECARPIKNNVLKMDREGYEFFVPIF